MGVGDSHGPYEWLAHSRRAPRARTISAWGLVVLVRPRGAPRGARRGCSDALTRGSRAPRGILACAGGSRTPRASPAPAQRAQRARAEAPGPPRGSGAAHGTTRRSATLAQMEHVRAPTFGDALRAAKTHPITLGALGARVVVVLGPLVRWWPPRGGGIQRKARIEPLDVRAEATQRAWVTLLSAWGHSVGYQGGRNSIIPFRRPPPDLLLEDSMPAGHVLSRAVRLTLRRTHIDSRPL